MSPTPEFVEPKNIGDFYYFCSLMVVLSELVNIILANYAIIYTWRKSHEEDAFNIIRNCSFAIAFHDPI